jgi:hypothetical protein
MNVAVQWVVTVGAVVLFLIGRGVLVNTWARKQRTTFECLLNAPKFWRASIVSAYLLDGRNCGRHCCGASSRFASTVAGPNPARGVHRLGRPFSRLLVHRGGWA